jgi:hypothetical protein
MTIRRPAIRIDLLRDSALLAWKNLAKDGADLPASQQIAVPAKHGIAIGETFDVEFVAGEPGNLQMVARIGGRQANGPVLGILPVRIVR